MDDVNKLLGLHQTAGHQLVSERQFNGLELAPHGWQPLIETMAKGSVETIGAHDYCHECGGIIQGVTGHRFDCSTMLARRLLTNYPLLLLRHAAGAKGTDRKNQLPDAVCT